MRSISSITSQVLHMWNISNQKVQMKSCRHSNAMNEYMRNGFQSGMWKTGTAIVVANSHPAALTTFVMNSLSNGHFPCPTLAIRTLRLNDFGDWFYDLCELCLPIANSPMHSGPTPCDTHADFTTVCPPHQTGKFASPFECVFGRLPDLSRVRTFGCTVWYRVPQRDLTNKCSPRFIKAIHLGFDPVGEGYRVFVPELKRFTCVPTKARFNEEQFISPGSLVGTHESFVGDEDDDAYVRTRALAPDQNVAQHRPDAGANPTVGDRPVQPARTGRFADRRPGRCAHTNCTLDAHGDDVPHSFEQSTHDTGLPSDGVRRNPRKREPPKQFIPGTNDTSVAFVYDGYWARRPMACFVDANVHKTPDSYNEAISGPFAERWKT